VSYIIRCVSWGEGSHPKTPISLSLFLPESFFALLVSSISRANSPKKLTYLKKPRSIGIRDWDTVEVGAQVECVEDLHVHCRLYPSFCVCVCVASSQIYMICSSCKHLCVLGVYSAISASCVFAIRCALPLCLIPYLLLHLLLSAVAELSFFLSFFLFGCFVLVECDTWFQSGNVQIDIFGLGCNSNVWLCSATLYVVAASLHRSHHSRPQRTV